MAPTTAAEFADTLSKAVPAGHVFENPGRGTTTIRGIDLEGVSYVRGHSNFKVSTKSLFDAYAAFQGKRVTTADLRRFAPEFFDSSARPAGHDCNCTVLFMLLHAAGLSGPIEGKGTRGSLFSVVVKR